MEPKVDSSVHGPNCLVVNCFLGATALVIAVLLRYLLIHVEAFTTKNNMSKQLTAKSGCVGWHMSNSLLHVISPVTKGASGASSSIPVMHVMVAFKASGR